MRTTGLVTPWIERSPATSKVVSPVFFQEVLLNVMVANCAASKKSGVLRCASRFSLAVLTLPTSITALTVLFSRLSRSTTITPLNWVKRPGTLVRKWRTAKLTDEWTGSIV